MIQNLGNPRLRDDLIWLRNGTKGLDRWTLHDPSSGEFFYFTGIEKDVMELFRGDKSLLEIHATLRQNKPGTDWTIEKLFSFLQVLLFNNLVLSDQFGKGKQLSNSIQRRSYQRRLGWLAQPLSIRIPLFRPHNVLKLLQPIESCLFHPFTIGLVLLLGILAIGFAALQWNEIVASLPPVESLIRGDRLVWLLVALAMIKTFHELGHAMACHKYAGTCGEIGLMLLVFTPCLYCDVSPSWMVKSRWQRVTIALAGIYVELILAIAAVLCLFLVPSEVVRATAVYIFVVCSMGTLFLNGNPLVKYDGYFALSDLLGVPNLSDQAREAASYTFVSMLAKNPPNPPTLDFSRLFLLGYWFLASVYRFFLLVLILWGINWLLRPIGLEFIAYYIAMVAIVGLAWSLSRAIKGVPDMFRNSGGLKIVSTVGWGIAVAALLGLFFIIPVADSVESRAIIRFEEMTPVFVQQPGQLVAAIHDERAVKRGEKIFELISRDRDAREVLASSEVELTTLKIQLRKELSVIALQDDLQLPALERTLDVRKRQLESISAEQQQLSYSVPYDGYWFHALPSYISSASSNSLKPWTGFPLEPQNIGAHFEKGVLLGWVVNRNTPVLEAFISETDLNRLALGARTFVRVDHQVFTTLAGEITAIGTEPIAFLPIEMQGDWHVMAQPDAQGRWIPESPMFRVIVRLDEPPEGLLLGGKATVLIETQPLTLAQQAYRFLRQTIFYRRQQAN